MNFGYTNDLVIFGVSSRRDHNLRSLPQKYLSVLLVKNNLKQLMLKELNKD